MRNPTQYIPRSHIVLPALGNLATDLAFRANSRDIMAMRYSYGALRSFTTASEAEIHHFLGLSKEA